MSILSKEHIKIVTERSTIFTFNKKNVIKCKAIPQCWTTFKAWEKNGRCQCIYFTFSTSCSIKCPPYFSLPYEGARDSCQSAIIFGYFFLTKLIIIAINLIGLVICRIVSSKDSKCFYYYNNCIRWQSLNKEMILYFNSSF